MDYHENLDRPRNRIDQEKIDFLMECGYKEEVILRCSLAMQTEMYRSNFKGRFGYNPPVERKKTVS